MDRIRSDKGVVLLNIKDVLSTIEAAKYWGFEESTVKKACQKGRFTPEEARKEDNGPRGRWFVTTAGMERLYGPMPEKNS